MTRKTLPWLFTEASCSQEAQGQQGHNPDMNTGCVFDISDYSPSEDIPDADILGQNEEAPLSDPISEFSPPQGASKAGSDRVNRNRTADVNQIRHHLQSVKRN